MQKSQAKRSQGELLKKWIGKEYLDSVVAKRLQKSYKSATPFPHAAFKRFLQEKKAQELKRALLKQQFTRKESDLFTLEQTHDLTISTDPVLKEFAMMLMSKEFATLITHITGVRITPGKIDLAGAIYRDTDYLLVHDDQVEGRKIAYVLNLSEGFTKNTGGALALLDSGKNNVPRRVVKRLVPTWNTMVCFTVSNRSHHQVEEVLQNKTRLTIGGWLHG